MTYLRMMTTGYKTGYPLCLEQTGFGHDAQKILEKERSFIAHYALPVSRSYTDPYVKFETNKLQWIKETKFLSSVEKIAMHPAYQRIVGMGMEAVPFILKELTKNPNQWFWALKAITNFDPVPMQDRGKVRKMAAAWVRWGQENGFV